MYETIELHLGSTDDGLSSRAFTLAVNEVTSSLEELERLVEPDYRQRVNWYVTSTKWKNGPTISLRPESRGSDRTTAQMLRPGRVLVDGVKALANSPQIPVAFTEGLVRRVAKIGDLTTKPSSGLLALEISESTATAAPARIDPAVDSNAKKAISPASLAYGSIVGRLDVITARGRKRRVGVVTDWGEAVSCEVEQLDRDTVLNAFDHRVLVEGVLRRNGSGQIIRIQADRVEVLHPEERIAVEQLRGLFKGENDPTVAEIMKELRG